MGIPGPRSLPEGMFKEWVCSRDGFVQGMGMSRGYTGRYTREGVRGGGHIYPLVLTPSGGYHNMYSLQASSMHPNGMLSCFVIV